MPARSDERMRVGRICRQSSQMSDVVEAMLNERKFLAEWDQPLGFFARERGWLAVLPESSTSSNDEGEWISSESVARVRLKTALPRESCSILPVAFPLRTNLGR